MDATPPPLFSAQQSHEHHKAITAAALAVGGGGGRELVHDITWKKIQQNTFTRWINQHLKMVGSSILDLELDLCDGIQLIKLAEVLSGKKIARYNKQPAMRTQKLDNVSLVLKFFQEEEVIKIVNIDSTHIVDQNLKLILGLIWTLILHYSISQPTLITTNQSPTSSTAHSKDTTPRQRLMAWIKAKLPAPVTNFTSDWNDGVALGGLVDACLPGACADWRQWSPDEALQNTLKAMRAAEDNLGIARLITPEELINPNIDEKSIMTYLSQFPRAKPQPRGRISGIEESPLVGQTTQFHVDVDGSDLQPEVQVLDPQGSVLLPISVVQNTAFPTRYDTSFVPKQVGKHKILVTLTQKPDADSSSQSQLQLKLNEVTVTAVASPTVNGLISPAELGEQQKFRVTNMEEDRHLDVLVVDPLGKELVVDCTECVGNSRLCAYTPKITGLHSVNVFLDKKHIPESPFPLRVHTSAPAAETALVWGRGVCPEGTCAGDELTIYVDNCSALVDVVVTTKEGLLVPVTQLTSPPHTSKDKKGGSQTARQSFSYIPRSAGPFTVEVRGGRVTPHTHLGQSPYKIKVGPRNTSSIRAIGPGLEGGVAGQKAPFYVDTKGNTNLLEFSIEGPSKTDIQCVDNGDGTAVVEYTPISSGRYVVNVLNDGNHIKDSPFIVMIDPKEGSPTTSLPQTPLQIRASGFEEWNKSTVGEPFKFSIGKTLNLEGEPLDVAVYDPNLKRVDSVKKHTTSASYNFSFLPEKPGKHVISVTTEEGVAVAGWPFPVVVRPALELSKLRVFGPGVGSNVLQDQKTSFTIDSRAVGSNDVEALISDPEGLPTTLDLLEDNAGMFTATYTPTKTGEHKIKVLVEREPTFDIKIDVGAAVKIEDNSLDGKDAIKSASYRSRRKNSSSISSNGSSSGTSVGKQHAHTAAVEEHHQILPTRVQLAKEIPQTIVGHEASLFLKFSNDKPDSLTASIRAPDGSREDILVEPHQKDQYKVSFFPRQPGLHSISVLHEDNHIEGSPFQVPVGLLGSGEAHRAQAYGDGLLSGQVYQLQSFKVSAGSVGAGELSVTIDGPSKADVVIKDEGEGNCRVDYSVSEPGLYEIFVKFNDANIADSPFRVFIKPSTSPTTTSPIDTTKHSDSGNKSGVSQLLQPSQHNGQSPLLPSSTTSNGQWKKQEEEPLQPVDENVFSLNSRLKTSATMYDGDAGRVVAQGVGLREFHAGQPASFTIDTVNAGTNLLFVGVVTSRGPCDEVFVKHRGNGFYQISYRIPDASSKALVFVKYGEAQISGSPFTVAPK